MRRILTFLVLFTAACAAGGSSDGNDDDHNGTGDSANWTISATLSEPTLTIQHGGTGTTTLTVTRGGGFTGAVEVMVDSIPGLTAVVSNEVTTGTVTTALVSVTAGTGSDVVYSIPLGVHANSSVMGLHADPLLQLNITRKNGFWVSAPATLSVPRGGAFGPISVHFTKTGFTDDVTLSLALLNGAPAGITATFAPNPIVGDTNSTMMVSVDASVAEGSYSLGTRANGGGYQGTAPLALTVTAAAGLTLTPGASTIVVTKGGTNSTLITFGRTNLLNAITMSVTSTLPTGVSVSFLPNPSSGPTTLMQINATLATASGTYVLNITSGGASVPVVTIPLTVTVP